MLHKNAARRCLTDQLVDPSLRAWCERIFCGCLGRRALGRVGNAGGGSAGLALSAGFAGAVSGDATTSAAGGGFAVPVSLLLADESAAGAGTEVFVSAAGAGVGSGLGSGLASGFASGGTVAGLLAICATRFIIQEGRVCFRVGEFASMGASRWGNSSAIVPIATENSSTMASTSTTSTTTVKSNSRRWSCTTSTTSTSTTTIKSTSRQQSCTTSTTSAVIHKGQRSLFYNAPLVDFFRTVVVCRPCSGGYQQAMGTLR